MPINVHFSPSNMMSLTKGPSEILEKQLAMRFPFYLSIHY